MSDLDDLVQRMKALPEAESKRLMSRVASSMPEPISVDDALQKIDVAHQRTSIRRQSRLAEVLIRAARDKR